VGTSLNVYPAAGLLDFVPSETPVILIDPADITVPSERNVVHIKEKASAGMEKAVEIIQQLT